jgi:hypothetical protein
VHLNIIFKSINIFHDRLCGLMVSVEDYKHRGPGFDFSEGVGSGTGSTHPRDRIN